MNAKKLAGALRKRARRVNLPVPITVGFLFKKRIERPVAHLVFVAADFPRVVAEALRDMNEETPDQTLEDLLRAIRQARGVEIPSGPGPSEAGGIPVPEEFKVPLRAMGFALKDINALVLPPGVTKEEDIVLYCLQHLGRT
jgi:hypothetical protein